MRPFAFSELRVLTFYTFHLLLFFYFSDCFYTIHGMSFALFIHTFFAFCLFYYSKKYCHNKFSAFVHINGNGFCILQPFFDIWFQSFYSIQYFFTLKNFIRFLKLLPQFFSITFVKEARFQFLAQCSKFWRNLQLFNDIQNFLFPTNINHAFLSRLFKICFFYFKLLTKLAFF